MDFSPLRIATIRPDIELTFDLYIYYKDTYLKYQDKGTSIPNEKYKKLSTQKIALFYIDKNDESKYQEYLDSLLADPSSLEGITVEEKINIVDGTCQSAIEEAIKNPETEESYKMTEKAAEQLKKVLSTSPEALKKIFEKKAVEVDLLIKHSMNVAALSTRLAIRVGCSDKEISNISTAGLLHDVGITRLNKKDQSLFKKAKEDLSDDENRIYNLHVKDAVSALKDQPWSTPEVIELIVNHEEVLSGKGPNKKKDLSLPIMILSLVNRYDKLVTIKQVTPVEALKLITINEIQNYDLDLINKFKDVLIDEGLV